MNIIHARLSNQYLGEKKWKTADEVVGWLGAVQSQDFGPAKWGIALRMKNAADATLEEVFNKGTVLRTHVMRPTWHFVLPDDIRWMQELTAHRVRALLGHYDRKLGIDRKLISKTNALFEKVLEGSNYRTRDELAHVLKKHRITATGQKLAHIVMHAELDGVICSGPRLGKQFSYALVDERAPNAKRLRRDEALAILALKYFQSHGPAQLKDFAWWSGLTLQEAEQGFAVASRKLEHETVEGKEYWFSSDSKIPHSKSPVALLLSIYDEYTIAYKDRSALGEHFNERLLSMGNLLTAVLLIDGMITGTWKRIIKKDTVDVIVSPLRRLRNDEKEAVANTAKQFGKFLGLESNLSFKQK